MHIHTYLHMPSNCHTNIHAPHTHTCLHTPAYTPTNPHPRSPPPPLTPTQYPTHSTYACMHIHKHSHLCWIIRKQVLTVTFRYFFSCVLFFNILHHWIVNMWFRIQGILYPIQVVCQSEELIIYMHLIKSIYVRQTKKGKLRNSIAFTENLWCYWVRTGLQDYRAITHPPTHTHTHTPLNSILSH